MQQPGSHNAQVYSPMVPMQPPGQAPYPVPQMPGNQGKPTIQLVKIYKSGIFGMSSAAGNFERDWLRSLQPDGWRIDTVAYSGFTVSRRQVLTVIYER